MPELNVVSAWNHPLLAQQAQEIRRYVAGKTLSIIPGQLSGMFFPRPGGYDCFLGGTVASGETFLIAVTVSDVQLSQPTIVEQIEKYLVDHAGEIACAQVVQ
jgi:hypothetical protein